MQRLETTLAEKRRTARAFRDAYKRGDQMRKQFAAADRLIDQAETISIDSEFAGRKTSGLKRELKRLNRKANVFAGVAWASVAGWVIDLSVTYGSGFSAVTNIPVITVLGTTTFVGLASLGVYNGKEARTRAEVAERARVAGPVTEEDIAQRREHSAQLDKMQGLIEEAREEFLDATSIPKGTANVFLYNDALRVILEEEKELTEQARVEYQEALDRLTTDRDSLS